MSLTVTIGGTAFGHPAAASGRYVRDWRYGEAQVERRDYHPAGVNGEYRVFGGRTKRKIGLTLRYIQDTVAALEGAATTDEAAWQNASITITGPDATDHTRCALTRFEPATPIAPTGITAGQVFRDYIVEFEKAS